LLMNVALTDKARQFHSSRSKLRRPGSLKLV
jgi:hypothetical protein